MNELTLEFDITVCSEHFATFRTSSTIPNTGTSTTHWRTNLMDLLIFVVELAANGLVRGATGATVILIFQCEHNSPMRKQCNQQHL